MVIQFSKKIQLLQCRNPITGVSFNGELVYTLPLDDYLIIGYRNGQTAVYFDFESNAGTYDETQRIGRAQINADGNIEALQMFDNNAVQLVNSMGFTGTISPTNTVTVKNGIIYKVV